MSDECLVLALQFSNGLVGPVRMFDLVQFGFGEGAVQVLDGHLVKGDHVLELGHLSSNMEEDKRETKKTSIKVRNGDCLTSSMKGFNNNETTVSPLAHTEQCDPWILQYMLMHFCSVREK